MVSWAVYQNVMIWFMFRDTIFLCDSWHLIYWIHFSYGFEKMWFWLNVNKKYLWKTKALLFCWTLSNNLWHMDYFTMAKYEAPLHMRRRLKSINLLLQQSPLFWFQPLLNRTAVIYISEVWHWSWVIRSAFQFIPDLLDGVDVSALSYSTKQGIFLNKKKEAQN